MTNPNDPGLRSWLEVEPDSDFPIQNLPFGVFRPGGGGPRVGVAIGTQVVDLSGLQQCGLLEKTGLSASVFLNDSLNDLLRSCGKSGMRELRERVSELLRSDNPELRDDAAARQRCLHPIDAVQMLMPVVVRDYTDFYSSEQHAYNVGCMFRDPDNALLPNWKHLPVAYHGRASSIVVSGVPVRRPKGQTKAPDSAAPVFGPTRRLDFELEMAFVTFQGKPLGESISTAEAEEHIFGLVLFNDWSARDIQAWEYVPLGPFLAKNFASSISPWIVTLDALEPFRVAGPKQEPEVLPYLRQDGDNCYDINLEVYIAADGHETRICRSNFRHMYWSMRQQLAHHTVSGCNINVGDMMASGTISGPQESAYGSMLELSWMGSRPVCLADGSERRFIQDHDTVIMRGWGQKEGVRIGFGEVAAQVLPAE